MDVLHILIGAALGGVSTCCFAYFKFLKTQRKALHLILRYMLDGLYAKYKRKGVTSEAKHFYQDVYETYVDLGGNGVETQKHDEVMAMEEKLL